MCFATRIGQLAAHHHPRSDSIHVFSTVEPGHLDAHSKGVWTLVVEMRRVAHSAGTDRRGLGPIPSLSISPRQTPDTRHLGLAGAAVCFDSDGCQQPCSLPGS